MRLFIIPITLIIAFMTISPRSAVCSDEKVTGVFSTFRLSEKSGDIVGAEIHIVPNPKGYSAIVQGSEGAPGFPEVVTIFFKGNSLTFTISSNSASGLPPGKYTGRVTRDGLLLNGPTESFTKYKMPRKRSYWQ
jgi:hypothetical protein